jgi:transposase, IS6 family
VRTIPSRGLLIPTITPSTHPRSCGSKAEGALEEDCQHRPVQYLNNILEQDHRAIKRRVRASQHFRSFWGAWRTIAGYEAVHMIRKGQACWSATGAKVGLLHRFIVSLFAATN